MKLHDKLFRGVTRAAMVFFNNNPSGRILNRFSRDIGNIDALLPTSLIDCLSVSVLYFAKHFYDNQHAIMFQFFLEFFATMVIVAIANYWLLIPTLIMTIFFYVLRYIYINTARSIKRIESLSNLKIVCISSKKPHSFVHSSSQSDLLSYQWYPTRTLHSTCFQRPTRS